MPATADLLAVLAEAEADLPRLLAGPWHSLAIDYHPPRVDRLWCTWRDYRLYLHRIHPCAAADALFHPHPWPSAMRVHSGTYEMAIGHGAGDAPPPIAARVIAHGPMVYEMTDRDAWHSVRPLGGVAITVMISGAPWSRAAPPEDRPQRALHPLAPEIVAELLAIYRAIYPDVPSPPSVPCPTA